MAKLRHETTFEEENNADTLTVRLFVIGLFGDFDDLFEAAAELFDDHGLGVDLTEVLLLGFFCLSEQTLASGLDNLRGHETERLPEKKVRRYFIGAIRKVLNLKKTLQA